MEKCGRCGERVWEYRGRLVDVGGSSNCAGVEGHPHIPQNDEED